MPRNMKDRHYDVNVHQNVKNLGWAIYRDTSRHIHERAFARLLVFLMWHDRDARAPEDFNCYVAHYVAALLERTDFGEERDVLSYLASFYPKPPGPIRIDVIYGHWR